MNKHKQYTTHRRLALKKETVVYLNDDLLKNAVGGDISPIPSIPISSCPSWCADQKG